MRLLFKNVLAQRQNGYLKCEFRVPVLPSWRYGLGLRQVEQGFSSFKYCQMFAIFDDFSKRSALKVLQNSEKSSNMANFAKIKIKPFLNPFF